MERQYRSFEFEGALHHLDEAPAVRDHDLATGAATVVNDATGATHSIRAADLNIALPASAPAIEDRRRVDLRSLIERGLELDYSDRDIVELIEVARRHALLREGTA